MRSLGAVLTLFLCYIQLIPDPLTLHLPWLWSPSTYSFLIVPIKSLSPGTLITVCPNELQITILRLKLQSLKLATRSCSDTLYLPLLSVLTLRSSRSPRPQLCDLQHAFSGLVFPLTTEHWQELFLYPQSNAVPISQQTNSLSLNMAISGKFFVSRSIRFLHYIPCVTHYTGNSAKMTERLMNIASTRQGRLPSFAFHSSPTA